MPFSQNERVEVLKVDSINGVRASAGDTGVAVCGDGVGAAGVGNITPGAIAKDMRGAGDDDEQQVVNDKEEGESERKGKEEGIERGEEKDRFVSFRNQPITKDHLHHSRDFHS